MAGLSLRLGARKLEFASTLEVLETQGGQPVAVGTWRSESAEGDNRIRYTLAAVEQAPLAASYRFNENNQLVIGLQGGEGAQAEFAYSGRIEILRDHHLGYFLVTADGADTGKRITVYLAGLEIAEATNHLRLKLAGGATAEIAGASGVQSLEAERNTLPKFQAEDLLTFEAETTNPEVESGPIPAVLEFGGSFDLVGDRLVFLSEVVAGAKPAVSIGFAGRVGAVTGGFVYYADGQTTEVALNIRGQHTFRPGSGTELAWETTLGYTGKKFSAAVDVNLEKTTAKGGLLDLHGTLRFEKPAGGEAPSFVLNLRASYGFDAARMLVFTAKVEGGAQPSYDLQLEGKFVYSNLKLTFDIHYSNVAGAQSLQVEVGLQGNKANMKVQLEAVLGGVAGGRVNLKASVEVRMRFVNGVRVKELLPAA